MGNDSDKRWFKRSRIWFGVSVLALGVISIGLGIAFWNWLYVDDPEAASRNETIRNLALIVGGLFAFVFAWWRALVAERQTDAARSQVETGQNRADTALRALSNERYQRGAEMLGSCVLAVRLGGVYALSRLAEEYPVDYHLQVMQLLCAFVRNPTNFTATESISRELLYEDVPRLRDDIQAAITAIGTRSEIGRRLEWDSAFTLDLNGAQLVRADMRRANFSRADLRKANLTYGNLGGSDLCRVDLNDADIRYVELSGAKLDYSDMVNARLDGAIAQDTNFSGANLTGSVLFEADLRGSDFSEARCSESL